MDKKTRSVVLGFSVLITSLILTGCERAPDCEEAVREATELGGQGQLANFDEKAFPVACRADYLAAWESARGAFCDAGLAFARAMDGMEQPPACEDAAYLRNHQLGANLYALSEEKRAIERLLDQADIDGTSAQSLQATRMRLRVLEREIPELETLARMRGFMPPAELPPELREDSQGQ